MRRADVTTQMKLKRESEIKMKFTIRRTEEIEFVIDAENYDEALDKADEYVELDARKIKQTTDIICKKCTDALHPNAYESCVCGLCS